VVPFPPDGLLESPEFDNLNPIRNFEKVRALLTRQKKFRYESLEWFKLELHSVGSVCDLRSIVLLT